ncbi:MAG: hypothetical protein ACOC44_05115 [Promethearchaeia archaeon]
MKDIEKILQNVLKKIRPTEKELILINNVVKEIKGLISEKAEELDIKYTIIEPQGSTGIKQTQLRNDFDIDLFIGLDYELYKPKKKKLSKNQLKKHFKSLFKGLCNDWIIPAISIDKIKNPRLFYAEHPYVKAEYEDPRRNHQYLELDIVLYFDIEQDYIRRNGPITAVDRSPWHGRFVKNNLNKKQKDEVRLLKQFFKACYSYGDKSAVGRVGFIGYSAELLIYHFEDIITVFQHFGQLQTTALDYFGRDSSKLKNKKRFQNDYLIIVDPVDKNRNVASAISERAYNYCNKQIKEFLKDPEESYFQIEPLSPINKDAENIDHFFIVELQNTDLEYHYTVNRDKLYSLGDYIINIGEKEFTHEERFGTIIFELYFDLEKNEYSLAFYCAHPTISQTYIRRGPSTKNSHHAKKFMKKNPNTFEKNGYLWTETERKYAKFLNFLEDHIPQKLPKNLKLKNISDGRHAKTMTGKRALYVLENMVLPFSLTK